jgi:hypothetical protein
MHGRYVARTQRPHHELGLAGADGEPDLAAGIRLPLVEHDAGQGDDPPGRAADEDPTFHAELLHALDQERVTLSRPDQLHATSRHRRPGWEAQRDRECERRGQLHADARLLTGTDRDLEVGAGSPALPILG